MFSFHTFSGMVGSAVAPVTLLFLQDLVGWRGAFLSATVLGLLAALFLVLQKELPARRRPQAPSRRTPSLRARRPTAGGF